jgi:hypothetical protein
MNICLSVTKCCGSEVKWITHLLTQIKSMYGIPVYDNPFSQSQFGIDCNDDFILFNTTGTIVYFESRVPTDWETCHLPIIMLTGEDWDPVNVGFGNGHSREQAEMRMIRSLEIGVTKWKMAAMKQCEMNSRVEQWGQVERELSKLSSTLHEKTFCKCLIGSVNVVTAYHDDVDEAMEKCKASVLTSDRHSKIGPEELSRKWNIGLEMAKATLDVTTQHGVRTAVQPSTADVLAAVGMFDVTMVTGSASVGVTTAYSPSPLKPVISCWMPATPSPYSSEISMGFRKSTKTKFGQGKGDSLCQCHQDQANSSYIGPVVP